MERKKRIGKTTSAGYRFPLSEPVNDSSEFHQTCVPGESRKPGPRPGSGSKDLPRPDKDPWTEGKDAVKQDEVWKEFVRTEQRGTEEWKENWGFLTEFDAKGRPKSSRKIPEKINMYSESVANTSTGSYGSQLNTQLGKTMQNLEFQFYSGHRRKKAGDDLICY